MEEGKGERIVSITGIIPTHIYILFDCCLLFSICAFISLRVASVALARLFMPGLYSTAYRATFPAFYAVASSLFLLFV